MGLTLQVACMELLYLSRTRQYHLSSAGDKNYFTSNYSEKITASHFKTKFYLCVYTKNVKIH
jgi:hypothetical protein